MEPPFEFPTQLGNVPNPGLFPQPQQQTLPTQAAEVRGNTPYLTREVTGPPPTLHIQVNIPETMELTGLPQMPHTHVYPTQT